MSTFRRRLMMAMQMAVTEIIGWFRGEGWFHDEAW